MTERTTQAINYQYRSGPTIIDFRGTVLLPSAKGDADVESQRGRTEINARFQNLTPPSQYGREYLTYTLWAITPEGAARNLGEIVPDGGNKAKIHVTTDLQAFGLLVTAEPYSTSRLPSDVVVMENQVRPDTAGMVKPIQAKFELLPRGSYTYQVPDRLHANVDNLPKVSMREYEAMLEVYEAQNAIGIAQSAGAATYAASTFQRAQDLLARAQQAQANHADYSSVVQYGREAAQTAEDARVIAERRKQDDRVASAERQAADAQAQIAAAVRAQQQAQADMQRAVAEAQAAKAQTEEERAARRQAELAVAQAQQRVQKTEADRAMTEAAPPPPGVVPNTDRTETRRRLCEQLNGRLETRDTPRGIVVTIPDSAFSGPAIRDSTASDLVRIATILAPYDGLRVDVEGFSDSGANEGMAWNRADEVGRWLVRKGLPASRVAAKGLGDSRPIVANSSESGRIQNRRVEIVISGDAIGTLPSWDRTYSITPGTAKR